MILFLWKVAEAPFKNVLKAAVHMLVFQERLLVMISFILVEKIKRRVSLFETRRKKKNLSVMALWDSLLSHAML